MAQGFKFGHILSNFCFRNFVDREFGFILALSDSDTNGVSDDNLTRKRRKTVLHSSGHRLGNDFGPGGTVSGDERNDQEQIGGAIEIQLEIRVMKPTNSSHAFHQTRYMHSRNT